MGMWMQTASVFCMTLAFLCNYIEATGSSNPLYRNLNLPSSSSENFENDVLTCPCKKDDIGLKYLCAAYTQDVEQCILDIVKTIRGEFQPEPNQTHFRRIRKQLSFNGALSSIAGMLNGEQMKNRDALLRYRIKEMGK